MGDPPASIDVLLIEGNRERARRFEQMPNLSGLSYHVYRSTSEGLWYAEHTIPEDFAGRIFVGLSRCTPHEEMQILKMYGAMQRKKLQDRLVLMSDIDPIPGDDTSVEWKLQQATQSPFFIQSLGREQKVDGYIKELKEKRFFKNLRPKGTSKNPYHILGIAPSAYGSFREQVLTLNSDKRPAYSIYYACPKIDNPENALKGMDGVVLVYTHTPEAINELFGCLEKFIRFLDYAADSKISIVAVFPKGSDMPRKDWITNGRGGVVGVKEESTTSQIAAGIQYVLNQYFSVK